MEGIHAMQSIIQCANKTGTVLFVAKLHIAVAFDGLLRSGVVRTLLSREIPIWEVHALMEGYGDTNVFTEVDEVQVKERVLIGAAQGLSDSMWQFVRERGDAMKEFEDLWKQLGLDFRTSGAHVVSINQVDDIVVIPIVKEHITMMIAQYSDRFNHKNLLLCWQQFVLVSNQRYVPLSFRFIDETTGATCELDSVEGPCFTFCGVAFDFNKDPIGAALHGRLVAAWGHFYSNMGISTATPQSRFRTR